ncbi:DUF6318 family protein [Nocardioides sp. Root151]|uniref:DUF6318 family protein n=1 Tax=Nocardioides sp. Root151 TaxID=1736475 RepID=UPI0007030F27|nr:DUF6318 family protein [Nocardioides sp. Root151]KQZ70705.1 hypothetical protein ASD66_14110 [Nocardioides sp. Root151]
MTVLIASSARRVLALVLALALVLFAASCSDDDPDSNADPTPSPSDTTTPSPTTSTTADAEPTEPPEPDGMGEDSKRGAELLVRYYLEVVDYAQLTGDVRKLKTLARPGCEACNTVATGLHKIYKQDGFVRGGRHTIQELKVTRLDSGEHAAFRVDLTLHSSRQTARASAAATLDTVPKSVDDFLFALSMDTDGQLKVDLWQTE